MAPRSGGSYFFQGARTARGGPIWKGQSQANPERAFHFFPLADEYRWDGLPGRCKDPWGSRLDRCGMSRTTPVDKVFRSINIHHGSVGAQYCYSCCHGIQS
jgi:hypothetical protein